MNWPVCLKRGAAVFLIGFLACPPAQAGFFDRLFGQHASGWSKWNQFSKTYVSEDGRVIDHGQVDARTVSEGQAYALFFSFVANDRKRFDQLLAWTENNLAKGDLYHHLPAWIWGKHGSNWEVIDSNSAADADLWLAYTLSQAGQQWCSKVYMDKAKAIANNLLNQETLNVSGLGLSLLPGQRGFVKEDGSVKLNPSYAPSFILRQFAELWPHDARWAALYLGNQRLLLKSASMGSVADWVLMQNGQLKSDPQDTRGDYDAIRVYLWLGMEPEADPLRATLIAQLSGYIQKVVENKTVPSWTDPWKKQMAAEPGPPGFQMALAPLMKSIGYTKTKDSLFKQGLNSEDSRAWLEYGYYNSVLSLFASGIIENKYRIGSKGELIIPDRETAHCEK